MQKRKVQKLLSYAVAAIMAATIMTTTVSAAGTGTNYTSGADNTDAAEKQFKFKR